MKFTYYNPVKIRFGVDYLEAIKSVANRLQGARFLLVTSKGFSKRGLSDKIANALGTQLVGIIDEITPNPQVKHLRGIKSTLAEFDAIIALGGGSVIDSAKFLSVDSVLENGNFIIKSQPKYLYALPTTSGTSSELTHWATIWDNDAFIKHSLSDEILYPKEAIYDPRLTLSLPRETTIHTALDALSHSFESIWNNNANPISTHYALNAIEIILRDLVDLSHNLDSLPLRTHIMQASMYAGLAFSNTQTALAHALSYPLTMRFGTPHGLACSFSLPLLLDCLPRTSHADALLSPFRERLLWLFDTLEISTNPKDYGLDLAFIDEIFATLNARAKNGIFDIARVRDMLKRQSK
ncbi:phosphonoacetaldehyde reductase [Helicobacter sp. 23-1046]